MDYRAGALIIAGIAVLLITLAPETKAPTIELFVQENQSEGNPFSIKAVATGTGMEKILLKTGVVQEEFLCSNKEQCTVEKELVLEKGIYEIEAALFTLDGQKTEAEKKVVVTGISKKCLDKTAFSQCSEKKPFYCNNGVVEENCPKCGCPTGYYCADASCEPSASLVGDAEIIFPKKVVAGKQFSVSAEFFPEKKVVGSKYGLMLSIGNQEFYSEQIVSDAPIVFEKQLSLEEGVFDLNFSVRVLNNEKELAYNYYEAGAIESVPEIPVPEKPVLQKIFREGDDALLSWGDVNEAESYSVYISNNVNPAFITYRLYSETLANSVVLQALENGTYFFVVTAKNHGGESGYSNVENISIS